MGEPQTEGEASLWRAVSRVDSSSVRPESLHMQKPCTSNEKDRSRSIPSANWNLSLSLSPFQRSTERSVERERERERTKKLSKLWEREREKPLLTSRNWLLRFHFAAETRLFTRGRWKIPRAIRLAAAATNERNPRARSTVSIVTSNKACAGARLFCARERNKQQRWESSCVDDGKANEQAQVLLFHGLPCSRELEHAAFAMKGYAKKPDAKRSARAVCSPCASSSSRTVSVTLVRVSQNTNAAHPTTYAVTTPYNSRRGCWWGYGKSQINLGRC